MSADKQPSNSKSPDLADLERALGYQFRDQSLLELALTHPSVAHEKAAPLKTNQRLEFLGDAVLGLVLSRELYARFPDVDEGDLSKARAQLVNETSLARHARRLRLGDFLFISRGEETSGARNRDRALADAFEALLAAIYLDSGLEEAGRFITICFGNECSDLGKIPVVENPKGELQELLQAGSSESPKYMMVSATGPDHDRTFECIVQHGGVQLASGRGKSKQAAESDAAKAALEKLRPQQPSIQQESNE